MYVRQQREGSKSHRRALACHLPVTVNSNTMKQFFFAAALLLTLILVQAGCTCNSSNKNVEADSVQTAKNIAAEDSIMVFDSPHRSFIASTLQSDWNWSNFTLQEFWAEDSIVTKPYTTDTGFYQKYGPVLRWSPDSSYVLDFGSYGSVVTKDLKGNDHLVAGDPDTEVSLLYPKDHKKWRLFFGGPSTHVLNAAWTDTTEVAILGSLETDTSQADTLLWLIDVKQNFFRRYKWH